MAVKYIYINIHIFTIWHLQKKFADPWVNELAEEADQISIPEVGGGTKSLKMVRNQRQN